MLDAQIPCLKQEINKKVIRKAVNYFVKIILLRYSMFNVKVEIGS